MKGAFKNGQIESVDRIAVTSEVNSRCFFCGQLVRLRVARHCSRGSCFNQDHLVSVLVLKMLNSTPQVQVLYCFDLNISLRGKMLTYSRLVLCQSFQSLVLRQEMLFELFVFVKSVAKIDQVFVDIVAHDGHWLRLFKVDLWVEA